MTTESIISLILSIVTTITAVIAVVISVTQISKSNKQSLFDRRLKIYLKVMWLRSLCEENKTVYKTFVKDSKEGPLYSIDVLFVWMTNTTYLEDIQPVINHVLEPEWQRKYLLKMEELKNLCEEARLAFSDDVGYPLADFIDYYQRMIVSIYKYQIVFNDISDICQKENKGFPDNDKLENDIREKVIKNIEGTFVLSEKLFSEGILEKVRLQIKL